MPMKLNELNIFSTLSEADAKAIQKYVHVERFGKKDMIITEGDPPDWLYVVMQGKVKITRISEEGKEIILEIIPPGDLFGAVAVIRGFPYPANAVAMEDSEVLKISRGDLMTILDSYPTVMYCFVQIMGDRLKDTHDTLKSIALEKVGTRIASLLLKLSEQAGKPSGDGTVLDLRLTKQDIAEMVGTTVETAIRTMSRFKKQGLIAEKSGKIIIKSPDRLRALGSSIPRASQ
ncbi:MAG: Crp/Fnr family transcriptional regulator [Thermodesulfovibrionales bacterium]